jgi:GTP-binding protein
MAVAGEVEAEGAAGLEAGRLLFAGPCTFLLGVADLVQLPPVRMPEVAFAGRSNVGKSSLINALTGRRQLARTSQTPGRTQQLNFFDLGGRLMLVDLPGYGYAKAPKAVVGEWQHLLRLYLRGRGALRQVCVLVDARHGLKDSDLDIMALLGEAAVVFQVVLTKIDQVRAADRPDLVAGLGAALARLPGAHPLIMATSVREQLGIASLRATLAALAAPAAPSRDETR